MPVRRFRITKPYALSTTEVTWDQFRQFVEATGYQTEAETNGLGGHDREFKPDPNTTWRTPGWKPAPNEPVTQVTPRDAEAFCEWLTESSPHAPREESGPGMDVPSPADSKTNLGSKPLSLSSRGAKGLLYRLPTEAEWLHACRAGSVHKHVAGPEPSDLADYAWTQEFLDPNPQASPLHLVAQKKPNPFGLHDTLGNVWEYTRDFGSPAPQPYLLTNDPLGTSARSVIGQAWNNTRNQTHPDWIYSNFAEPHSHVGFRVLRQFDGESLPGLLARPLVLRPGQPLSVHALVPRPEKIIGLQSWSIELAGPHNWATVAIAVNPKSDLIATAGDGFGKISLWDRDGNYQRALLGHEGQIRSLDFSPDGRWLASCELVQNADAPGLFPSNIRSRRTRNPASGF